jgi:two-component system, sensor histidine kinase FlrB
METTRLRIYPADDAAADATEPLPPANDEAALANLDLQSILQVWNEATDRLQRTHEALRAEVHRLSDELESKNRELARQNRLADLGQMASHIAHEVRNCLVPMKLYLSLLRRRIDDDSGSLRVLEQISAGFSALESTVGDLLNFSADREPQCRAVEVPELLHEVFQSLAPQLEAQQIVVHVDATPGAMALADRDMLRRAIVNLVLNALDAMPRGGELVVTACRCHGALEIEVADSGPGIGEAAMRHLFEPFFTTKSAGTGLGLAIVERIAEAHQGEVLVANCPEGGAAFTLRIPEFRQTRAWKAAA